MTEKEYKEKVRKMVYDHCAPGIEKFKKAETLQYIFNGIIEDAKREFSTGNSQRAKFLVDAAKAFRNAALTIFMGHPEYDELKVLSILAPSEDVKLMCEQFSEID